MPAGVYDHRPELRKPIEPIKLIIDIEPVAKGRPRISFRDGKVRGYTPQKTQEAQDYIKAVLAEYKDKMFPAHVPVKLTVTFWRKKPKWTLKREFMPVRKSDLDNYVKLISDSINGILVKDDAQIVSVEAKKRWSSIGKGYIQLELCEDVL